MHNEYLNAWLPARTLQARVQQQCQGRINPRSAETWNFYTRLNNLEQDRKEGYYCIDNI